MGIIQCILSFLAGLLAYVPFGADDPVLMRILFFALVALGLSNVVTFVAAIAFADVGNTSEKEKWKRKTHAARKELADLREELGRYKAMQERLTVLEAELKELREETRLE